MNMKQARGGTLPEPAHQSEAQTGPAETAQVLSAQVLARDSAQVRSYPGL
jgi:hypothetical protein